jgi:hypothetical protein
MKTTNLFFCPKCGSKRVGAVFYVPVGKIGKVLTSPTPPKDYFELINRREKKIDSILDDIKI